MYRQIFTPLIRVRLQAAAARRAGCCAECVCWGWVGFGVPGWALPVCGPDHMTVNLDKVTVSP